MTVGAYRAHANAGLKAPRLRVKHRVITWAKVPGAVRYAVTLKNKTTMQRVSSFSGEVRPMGAEDDWLPPGGGLVLLLHE